MRIGHNPPFVFLSNPKCGSTSLRAVLGKYSAIKGEKHPTNPVEITHLNAHALKSYFEHDWYSEISEDEVTVGPWDEYYKFTTVRNPWKKMVSYYFFWAPDKDYKPRVAAGRGRNEIGYDAESAFSVSFNKWLKYVVDGQGLPHYEYFCCDHDTGECLMDDVFKVEEMNDVLPAVLKDKLNIELDSIPNLNPDFTFKGQESRYTSWKGDYYSLYNEESKDIISTIYSSDISTFNYSFGE